jgi:hypothetical protein
MVGLVYDASSWLNEDEKVKGRLAVAGFHNKLSFDF